MKFGATSTTVRLNGREMQVNLSAAARRELDRRDKPLFVELELYFSCLVKKSVSFRDDACGHATVAAGDKLMLYFRPVVSTACSIEVAKKLGRQPEMEIDSPALRRIAPKQVFLDHVGGQWRGRYLLSK